MYLFLNEKALVAILAWCNIKIPRERLSDRVEKALKEIERQKKHKEK